MRARLTWRKCRRLGCAVAALFTAAAPLRAQLFIELSGGLNKTNPIGNGEIVTNGWAARASVGWPVASRLRVRFDAFDTQFENGVMVASYPLTAQTLIAPPPQYDYHFLGVQGVTANVLFDVDPRGIFYLVGGGGYSLIYGTPSPSDRTGSATATVGAGFSIPVGPRFRFVIEADDHIQFAHGTDVPWIVPVTFGLRW